MRDMLTMFNLGRNIIGSNIYNHGTKRITVFPARERMGSGRDCK